MEHYTKAYAYKLRYYHYPHGNDPISEELRISYPYGVLNTLLQGGDVVVITPDDQVVTVIKSYPL